MRDRDNDDDLDDAWYYYDFDNLEDDDDYGAGDIDFRPVHHVDGAKYRYDCVEHKFFTTDVSTAWVHFHNVHYLSDD
jgi:hypothetical protein